MKHEPYIKQGTTGRWSGCYVQVPGCIGKLFSYSAYATEEACMKAAVGYRDMCVGWRGGWDMMPKRAGGGKEVYFKRLEPLKNNKLGILGVCRRVRIRNKRKYVMYVAQLKLPRALRLGELTLRADFYVNTHGRSGALAGAQAARASMEQYRDRLLDRLGAVRTKGRPPTLPRLPQGVRIVPRHKKPATVRGS